MKRFAIIAFTLLFIGIGITTASATPSLWDWAFYIDGTTYEYLSGDLMPVAGALDEQGLGTLTWQTGALGSHTFIVFFDHEIDDAINTYFNEYGDTINAPGAGQSWEIDEPGYMFGDIYDNVLAGSLGNSNGVPEATPDDVSWALGWGFTLTAGQTATIALALSGTAPSSGFYLSQTDPHPDSLETIYFSSTLNIEGGGPAPVPEPGTWLLLCCGLIGFFGFSRKRLIKG